MDTRRFRCSGTICWETVYTTHLHILHMRNKRKCKTKGKRMPTKSTLASPITIHLPPLLPFPLPLSICIIVSPKPARDAVLIHLFDITVSQAAGVPHDARPHRRHGGGFAPECVWGDGDGDGQRSGGVGVATRRGSLRGRRVGAGRVAAEEDGDGRGELALGRADVDAVAPGG